MNSLSLIVRNGVLRAVHDTLDAGVVQAAAGEAVSVAVRKIAPTVSIGVLAYTIVGYMRGRRLKRIEEKLDDLSPDQ